MFNDPGEQEKREQNTLLHEDETFSLGFTQMPNQVLYARNLSPQAKTLYLILLSYSWKEDRCFPGYARLCEHMNLSEKIVRKHMRELEAAKLLRQKRRGLGKTNIYTLLSLKNAILDLDSEPERDTSPVQERGTSPAQKRGPSPVKEYEVEEDTAKKDEESSKRQSRSTNKGKTVYSHRAPTTTRKDENRKSTTGSRPQRLSEILEGEPIFIGKPLTQDEIDAQRRQGKNASSITPLAIIPPEHRQQLETKAQQHPLVNLNKTNYNRSTKNAPLFVSATIEQLTKLLGDELESVPRDINRTAKLYRHSKMGEDDFRNMLYEVYGQAKNYSAERIKKKRADGGPNRMPLFFTVLEERLGFKPPKEKRLT